MLQALSTQHSIQMAELHDIRKAWRKFDVTDSGTIKFYEVDDLINGALLTRNGV